MNFLVRAIPLLKFEIASLKLLVFRGLGGPESEGGGMLGLDEFLTDNLILVNTKSWQEGLRLPTFAYVN